MGVANSTPCHPMATDQQDASFLPPLKIVLHFSYRCIIVVAKEILSPDIMHKLNLNLCDILQS